MEKEFLGLIPKRFLCPYCGEWHEWDEPHTLGHYDDCCWKAEFECSVLSGCNTGNYSIYFDNEYLYYSTESVCKRCYQEMEGRILISSIKEDSDKPIVTFEAEFTSNNSVGSYQCSDCCCHEECNFVKLGDKGDNRHMTITFGFEFEQFDYDKIVRKGQSGCENNGQIDYDKIVRKGQSGCENNGQMNQLLLLMLFKDKLGGDDDMMKMMLMASTTGGKNAGMNQLLPLMLFKDKLGGDDDMMKMMLMTSMMSVQAESDTQNTGMNELIYSEEEDDDDNLPF